MIADKGVSQIQLVSAPAILTAAARSLKEPEIVGDLRLDGLLEDQSDLLKVDRQQARAACSLTIDSRKA